MISLDTRFRPVGRMAIRTIGGESLLVPISGAVAGRCLYPLNETANAVWECLDANLSLREIIAELTRRFDVDPAEAEADCRALVDLLQAEGLVVPAGRSEERKRQEPGSDTRCP